MTSTESLAGEWQRMCQMAGPQTQVNFYIHSPQLSNLHSVFSVRFIATEYVYI